MAWAAVPAEAGLLDALAKLQQAEELVTPAAAKSASDAPPATAMCPDRCITYRQHPRLLRTCCDCSPPIKAVLQVDDKCRGCAIEVPVCLPSCCTQAPEVCCRPGILGRQVTHFKWCCGYHVKVVIDPCGDVVVHYYGK